MEVRRREGGLFIHITDDDGNTVHVTLDKLPRLLDDLLREIGVNVPSPLADHRLPAPDANVNALANLGKEWHKPAKRGRSAIRRIYFEPLHGWYGLLIHPGSATFRGQPLADLEARGIIARFVNAKVYFDEMRGEFCGARITQEDFEFIVEQIRTLERKDGGDDNE